VDEASAPTSKRPPRGASTEERPWGEPDFARDFPIDPDLAALVRAFTEGNYAIVRTGAPALAAKTTDVRIRDAAKLLRSRVDPDPSSRGLFVVTALLLIFLFAWWRTHDGPPRGAAPKEPPRAVEVIR
jgi:hypothetical protein